MKNSIKIFIILSFLGFVWACSDDDKPTPPPPTTKSSAKDITKFSFSELSPAIEGTISGMAIAATVPTATDVTKLTPTIVLSDKATVSPASGVVQDFSKEVSYTVTAEDGSTQVYKVNVSKAVAIKSSAKNILSVTFKEISPAITGTVDTVAKVAAALLPMGTELTKLAPAFTISEKATINPVSGTIQDFSKAITYTVTAEDGTTKVFQVSAVTDANYFSNIRLTVNEDNGSRSVNDSSLLDYRTGKVFSLKDGATNAANVDIVLNGYCGLAFYSPAAIIECGVSCGVGKVNEIIVSQKWASYRKSFIDNITDNDIKLGDFHHGQIASSEWSKLSFAADIGKQFNVGRALTLQKGDAYYDGQTILVNDNGACTPSAILDKVLYRFITQEGKKGVIKVNQFGKTTKGGYYVVIDLKIEK